MYFSLVMYACATVVIGSLYNYQLTMDVVLTKYFMQCT